MSSLSKFKLKKTHTFVSPSQIKECSAAGGGGGMGGGSELITRPYPLKVQACPPRNRRLATRSRVSGQEGVIVWGGGGTINMPISTEGSGMPTTIPKTGFPV